MLTRITVIEGMDGGQLVPLFEGICQDRGECEFRGSERDGNTLTLLVEIDRPTVGEVRADAYTLFEDLKACSSGDVLWLETKVDVSPQR